MKVEIERIDNGFILNHISGDAEQAGVMVFEEQESHKDAFTDLATLQRLLYCVCEAFGYHGSKHDKRRLFVRIENQHEENND